MAKDKIEQSFLEAISKVQDLWKTRVTKNTLRTQRVVSNQQTLCIHRGS